MQRWAYCHSRRTSSPAEGIYELGGNNLKIQYGRVFSCGRGMTSQQAGIVPFKLSH
jgi:hypothetical protein